MSTEVMTRRHTVARTTRAGEIRRHRSCGFTLIELMIVVGLVGMLAGMAIGFGGDWRRRGKLRDLTQNAYAALSLARSEASRAGMRTVVLFGNDRITVYCETTGTVGDEVPNQAIDTSKGSDPSCAANQVVTGVDDPAIFHYPPLPDTYEPDVTVVSPDLVGANGTARAVFSHDGLSVDRNNNPFSGSITISDPRLSETRTVEVSIAGAVRIRRP